MDTSKTQHLTRVTGVFVAGSSLRGVGQFEIKKTSEDDERAMAVVIAGDLSGESCLQVDVMANDLHSPPKDYESLLKTHDPWTGKVLAIDDPWHRLLVTAQNSLFCREIILLVTMPFQLSTNAKTYFYWLKRCISLFVYLNFFKLLKL